MSIELFEFSWGKYIFLGAVCIAQSIFAKWWMAGHPIWLIFSAAFWGLIFFTPLLFDIVPRIFKSPHHRALAEFQGIYYSFGGQRVRVFYSDKLVWLATTDVYVALGLEIAKDDMRRLLLGKRHRVIPNTEIVGISEEHLRSFVTGTRANEAEKFNLWFERGILLPIRNKVRDGLSIAEEVMAETPD